MIFALKDALADPAASIALKCDRIEPRARTAPFDFLGTRRHFPVTIYHLAAIFKRPVMLSFGIPTGPQTAMLYSSPRLDIAPDESRESVLARGHEHFQNFLQVVETQLRANPYLWFNFTPMNPPAP
jgi:predicted LPLAT superfamily acyltransferase